MDYSSKWNSTDVKNSNGNFQYRYLTPKDSFSFGDYGTCEKDVKVDSWCVSGFRPTQEGKLIYKTSNDMKFSVRDSLQHYNVENPKFLKTYMGKYGYDYINTDICGVISTFDSALGFLPFFEDSYANVNSNMITSSLIKTSSNLFNYGLCTGDYDNDDADSLYWLRSVRFWEEANGTLSVCFDADSLMDDVFWFKFSLDRDIIENNEGKCIIGKSSILGIEFRHRMSSDVFVIDSLIPEDIYLPALRDVGDVVYAMLKGFNAKYKKLSDISDVCIFLNSEMAREAGYGIGNVGISFGYELPNIKTPEGNALNYLVFEDDGHVTDLNSAIVNERFSKVSGGKCAICVGDQGYQAMGLRLLACI